MNGNDVKKRFQSLGQKADLSKIWKLCCRTSKGNLSKGECFVFSQILKLTNEGVAIPEFLTPEMLSAINKIDIIVKNNPNLMPKSVLA